MKIDEIKTIEQSISDGYFQRHGKQVKESEVQACVRFFEGIQGSDEPWVMELFNMVIDRTVLISGFDLENNEPRFIKNEIKSH